MSILGGPGNQDEKTSETIRSIRIRDGQRGMGKPERKRESEKGGGTKPKVLFCTRWMRKQEDDVGWSCTDVVV